MNIQNVILGFLLDEPMSGYDIKRQFEVSVSNFFEASFSGIYPALRKMEKDGLITKEVVIQEGKPNKNVFAVTERGREAFFEYLRTPTDATVTHSDFLIRIFFGKYASKDQIKEWITRELERVQENYQKLCKIRETATDYIDSFEALTLEFGIANSAFVLDWIKRFAKELNVEE